MAEAAGAKCCNMRLRFRQHKRVAMGLSDVAGWGSFLLVKSLPVLLSSCLHLICIAQGHAEPGDGKDSTLHLM